MNSIDTRALHEEIQRIRESAEQLRRLGDGFPAIEKNTDRMLACIKMMELGISDLYTLLIVNDQDTEV